MEGRLGVAFSFPLHLWRYRRGSRWSHHFDRSGLALGYLHWNGAVIPKYTRRHVALRKVRLYSLNAGASLHRTCHAIRDKVAHILMLATSADSKDRLLYRSELETFIVKS